MNGYVPLPASTALAVSSGSGLSTTTVRMTLKLNSAVASLTNISITGLYLNVEYQSSNVSNVLCATPSSNFAFAETSSSALTASMAKGESTPTGALTIPEYVYFSNKVYRVTSLANNAFNGCNGLTGSVTIPGRISKIDTNCFYGCSGITLVTIPSNITNIRDNAFMNCSSLATISGMSSVTSCGKTAFNGMSWYSNQSDGFLYLNNICLGYKGTMPASTSFTPVDGTRLICDNAFEGKTNLESIVIISDINYIGYRAFYGCTKLATALLFKLECLYKLGLYYWWSFGYKHAG